MTFHSLVIAIRPKLTQVGGRCFGSAAAHALASEFRALDQVSGVIVGNDSLSILNLTTDHTASMLVLEPAEYHSDGPGNLTTYEAYWTMKWGTLRYGEHGEYGILTTPGTSSWTFDAFITPEDRTFDAARTAAAMIERIGQFERIPSSTPAQRFATAGVRRDVLEALAVQEMSRAKGRFTAAIEAGASITDLSASSGISRVTIHGWAKSNTQDASDPAELGTELDFDTASVAGVELAEWLINVSKSSSEAHWKTDVLDRRMSGREHVLATHLNKFIGKHLNTHPEPGLSNEALQLVGDLAGSTPAAKQGRLALLQAYWRFREDPND